MSSTETWIYGFLIALAYLSVKRVRHLNELSHIPTVGYSGFFTSWRTAVDYIMDSPGLLQKGYETYPDVAFKIYTFGGWLVLVSGKQMVTDVQRARDDELSFVEVVHEQLQTKYTLGMAMVENTYHIDVIRSALTRNIASCFSGVHDEVIAAFNDLIPAKTNEWIEVPALDTAMQIVCRASNRALVGKEICRSPEYIKLNIDFTIQVFMSAFVINLFPEFLKPLVGNLMSSVRSSLKLGRRILGPTIQHRLDQEQEHGKDWPGRPNDMISWLLDSKDAGGKQRTVDDLTGRILTTNVAAIHTSSMTFTHALLDLAINKNLAAPLRQEVEKIIEEDGWTKKAMGNMHKLDSFVKESMRMWGLASLALSRKVLKPFTFSNGISVPVGTVIAAPLVSIHRDPSNYKNSREFEPFRFSDIAEEKGTSIGEHMVTPKSDYLIFGAGKHACPGRFFSASELKALLAYTLLNYDVKLEDDSTTRPANFWIANNMSPARDAKILFRKRLGT